MSIISTADVGAIPTNSPFVCISSVLSTTNYWFASRGNKDQFENVCLTMFAVAESLNITKTFIPTPPIFLFFFSYHHTCKVPCAQLEMVEPQNSQHDGHIVCGFWHFLNHTCTTQFASYKRLEYSLNKT